jgi:hypothetical protein
MASALAPIGMSPMSAVDSEDAHAIESAIAHRTDVRP